MIKFKVSKTQPWWTRDNDNKPSKEIFEKWCNENLVDATNTITINYDNFFNGTLKTKNGDFKLKYVKIINDDLTEPLYFYIDSINKIGPQGTYIYNITIDIWATFTLKYLDKIKNKKLIFNRTHNYDPKSLELNDTFLDSIPKLYENYTFRRKYFLRKDNLWYGENFAIEGTDLLNANKYYVFKDGVNGGYRFYPIISSNLKPSLTYTKRNRGELIFREEYWNGLWNYYGEHRDKVEIPDTVNEAVVNAYKNNDIVVYEFQLMHYGYVFPAHTIWLKGWKELEKIPWKTLPIDIKVNTDEYNNAGAGLRALKYFVYANGIQSNFSETWNITSSKHGDVDLVANQARKLRVSIYKNIPESVTQKIDNSLSSLEILRKDKNYINKFLGIFYLPHFLTFKSCAFNTSIEGYKFVYVDIEPKCDHIDTYGIFDYNLSNIQDKLNNDTYSTPYLLRYMDVKYFGNKINVEFRVNNQQQVFIGGKLIFTDTCNIVAKNSDLLSLENSIISFPYQLPIGIDQYEQYVKANRGVTDTGMAIARQQQELNMAKSIFGASSSFLQSAIMSPINSMGNLAKGDVGGAVSSMVGGAFSQVNNIANLGFSLAGQMQGIQQQQRKIQAQYQQVQMTTGNTIQFSNINNASLMEYYDSNKGEQFEGVAISEIDKSTLINLNNFITLNGYMLPLFDTLNNRLNNNRKFNYIQINPELLINSLTVYDDLALSNDVYNFIINQLTNGVRIWNSDDLTIEEYDPNEDWPIPERPIVPDIPIPDVTYDEIYINCLAVPLDQQYFDARGEIQSKIPLLLLENKIPEIENSKPNLVIQEKNKEDPSIYQIITNGVNKFTLNLNCPWNDKYQVINIITNENTNAMYQLDELVIKTNDEQWFNHLNSLSTFNPDPFNRGGWLSPELKDIKVKKVTILKV